MLDGNILIFSVISDDALCHSVLIWRFNSLSPLELFSKGFEITTVITEEKREITYLFRFRTHYCLRCILYTRLPFAVLVAPFPV